MNEYREVKSVTGLECTCEGKFRYKGKPKKVVLEKMQNCIVKRMMILQKKWQEKQENTQLSLF